MAEIGPLASITAMQRFGSDRSNSGHAGRPLETALLTRCGSGVCIAAVETMLTCVQGREAFSSPADALLDELHACSEAYPTPTPK